MVELALRCPSPPVETQGTAGPDRVGTAAAEEQLLGWTESTEEGGAQALQVAGVYVELSAEGGHEDEVEDWRMGVPSLADPSV